MIFIILIALLVLVFILCKCKSSQEDFNVLTDGPAPGLTYAMMGVNPTYMRPTVNFGPLY